MLDVLSTELVMHVAEFLPISSAALFALSCRTAYKILGPRFWTGLASKSQGAQRYEFLLQLSKDLSPEYMPCYHCGILHICELSGGGRYAPAYPRTTATHCFVAELDGQLSKILHRNFDFGAFRMTMKRNRTGLEYKRWLEILSYGPQEHEIMWKYTSEVRLDVRIINDSLMVCSERRTLLPPGLTVRRLDPYDFSVCPHVKSKVRGGNLNLPESAECMMDHKHTVNRCVRYSDLASCTQCATEYELCLEECADYGLLVVVRKWMDLGKGETVADPKWWSHLLDAYRTNGKFVEVKKVIQSEMFGTAAFRPDRSSIRDAFSRLDVSKPDVLSHFKTARRLDRCYVSSFQFLKPYSEVDRGDDDDDDIV